MWHRFCLKCDGCSTTLEPGRVVEGPLSGPGVQGCNVWCKVCYAKRFGPKGELTMQAERESQSDETNAVLLATGIGVAGISLPEGQV